MTVTTKPRTTKAAEPDTEKPEVPVYAFPLPASHYFSTPATSRRSASSGPHVASIQRVLDLRQTGTFDQELRTAVMGWQSKKKRKVTGVIDKSDWNALFNEV